MARFILSSLVHERCFQDILKPSIFREINLIRNLGNNAAHGHSISRDESLIALKNLFRFLSFTGGAAGKGFALMQG